MGDGDPNPFFYTVTTNPTFVAFETNTDQPPEMRCREDARGLRIGERLIRI